MTTNWKGAARTCLQGAESGAMTFPQIVGTLIEAGFDGYAVDLRRATAIYYRAEGEAVELETTRTQPVAETFDALTVKEAISEAQALVPGYTYHGFCAKVARAGCAGYLVSFLGKRVLYYGRSGETHTEYFPGTQPGTKP
ncbi:MAG TPA: hypothetical protein VMU52_06420 [Steroidobacteraceae bacterium]|nr:hypothetical protein [Steroidobacteraceae bacterium]